MKGKIFILAAIILYSPLGFGFVYQHQTNQQQRTHAASTQSSIKKTATSAENRIESILDKLTPEEQSALQKKLREQKKAAKNPFTISLFRPNYALPFYYTGSPDQAVYAGRTPDNQRIMNAEFKGQISLLMPMFTDLFHKPNLSLNIAYTQLMYWQFYAKSQWFRETDYEPEVFLQYNFHRNWAINAGAVHQSNGRGIPLERSWNRAFTTIQVSGANWLISLKLWVLIFKNESSNLHNPDIAHFLGHENLLMAYQLHKFIFSVQLQNIESGMKRGFVMGTISYPLFKHFYIYAQYFNGYGQSLIEYNHRTQSAGIGIALNDWI